MSKYVYPAVLTPNELGGYCVHFPDVESAFTSGKDLTEAMELAQDVLGLMLYTHETEGDEEIQRPTPINKIKKPKNSIVTYVFCDTDFYRNPIKGTIRSPAKIKSDNVERVLVHA